MILLQLKTKNENAKSIHEKIKNLPKKSYSKKHCHEKSGLKLRLNLQQLRLKIWQI